MRGFIPITTARKPRPARLDSRRDLSPIVIQVAGAAIITTLLVSDALTVAESLKTGYPRCIPYLIAFGIVGAIDVIYFGAVFCAKQLFALGRMTTATWLFYLGMAVALGAAGVKSAMLVVDHIDALGSKNRRILSPYDYSENPNLVAARRNVDDLKSQVEAVDRGMTEMTKTVETTGTQASSFTVALRAAIVDTSARGMRDRRDIMFYAGRANKAVASTAASLSAMQKERARLASALLEAMANLERVQSSLDARFGGKSAEDVVESDMGVSLKRNVAGMTQWAAVAVIVVVMVIGYAHSGVSTFNPIVLVPATDAKEAEAVATHSPDLFMPARGDASLIEYERLVADMYIKGEFPEYVTGTYLGGRLYPNSSIEAAKVRFHRLAKRRREIVRLPEKTSELAEKRGERN